MIRFVEQYANLDELFAQVRNNLMAIDIDAKQQQYTDEYLLGLVANQDVGAYEQLYERHSRAIFSLILRIVRNPSIAEELLQDVFWQIWQDAGQYNESGAAAAWMFRIGRNRSLDELRRRKARPQADEQADVESAYKALGTEQPSAESEAVYQINRQQITAALGDLPPDQRICVELAYFEGLTHKEISTRLTIPAGTVKSRLRIGMEKLERALRRVGYP